jgi:hypothetical protein
MITVPTTFIVGAGGSQPYGWPLGSELISLAKQINPNHQVYQCLAEGQDSSGRIRILNDFGSRIDRYPGPSLDAFLEDQPTFRDIGREIIAGLLAHRIGTEVSITRQFVTKPRPDNDWIGYIVKAMRAGAGSASRFVTQNAVKFVT